MKEAPHEELEYLLSDLLQTQNVADIHFEVNKWVWNDMLGT